MSRSLNLISENNLSPDEYSVLSNALMLRSIQMKKGIEFLSQIPVTTEDIKTYKYISDEWVKATNINPELDHMELSIYLKSKMLFEAARVKKLMSQSFEIMGILDNE